MHILMISTDYPPIPGGIAAHVHELANGLVSRGNRVTVVTRREKGQPAFNKDKEIEVHRLNLRYMAPLYGLQIRNFVKDLLQTITPDLIHIHGLAPLKWYDIHTPPLVYTNHTSGYLKRLKKRSWRQMHMLRKYFSKVDLFLAPSRELLETPFTIKAEKHYIPNGVDSGKFAHNRVAREQLRHDLKIDDAEKVCIVTRRLVDKNGVIHLARAARHLKDKNIRFLVIGDGPERKAVEQEFKHSYPETQVHFMGAKTHAEIIDFYSAADFSVLPSLMEATSISGLEAMAAGLPLVGSEVGGIPDLIATGTSGYLCKPGDSIDLANKINLLLTNDLQAMGQHARQRAVTKFDWQEISRQTQAAYQTILSTT